MKTEYPQTEEELRLKLSGKDTNEGLSDEDWQWLKNEGRIDKYIKKPGLEPYYLLLTQLREHRNPKPRPKPGRKPGSTTSISFKGIIDNREIKRAQVFSRAIARRAAKRKRGDSDDKEAVQPELVIIRERLFDGKRFTKKHATEFMNNVGLRHFGFEWFKSKRIPVYEHHSYYVHPATEEKQTLLRRHSNVVFEWGDNRRITYLEKESASHADLTSSIHLPIGYFKIKPDSVIGELKKAADFFAHRYEWEEADAVMFLLTGAVPPMPAIAIQDPGSLGGIHYDHYHPYITLRIEPWVSPESVKRAYERLQRKTTSKQARIKDDRSLDIFEFVDTYLEKKYEHTWTDLRTALDNPEIDLSIPWKEIAQEWNNKHQDFLTGREISRTFRCIYDEIIWPRFVPIGIKHKKKQKKMDVRKNRH